MRVWIAAVVWLVPSVVLADHPQVQEGRRLHAEADFAGALRAYAAAEAAEDLAREDLIALLEGRALVHYALDDRDATLATLRALASIDPAHEFPADVPPEVRAAFVQARQSTGGERVRLRIEREDVAGGVALRAVVAGDVGNLVREVVITARVSRERGGEWESGAGGILQLDAGDGSVVEYYAVAEGPGGAPVATLGTARAPRSFTLGAADGGLGAGGAGGEGGGTSPWIFVGIGAGVVAVGVVAAILIAGGGAGDQTAVECCTLVDL